MNKLIEKIVERTRELVKCYQCTDNEFQRGARAGAHFIANRMVEIIKEEAKAYTEEVCEWEDTENLRKRGICYSSDGLYKPSCNDDEDDFRDWNWIRHFKFCPYCGKKIKAVE